MRWATPVIHFRRTATRDVDVGGQPIKAGEKVVLWYNSANRDERAFPDPYRFDVTRTPNEHVGFGGGGPHFCLGANLARREIKVMFEELLRRLPDIEIAGEPDMLQSASSTASSACAPSSTGAADRFELEQVAAPLPLPTLLSQALVAFTIELDAQFELEASRRGTWLTSYVM